MVLRATLVRISWCALAVAVLVAVPALWARFHAPQPLQPVLLESWWELAAASDIGALGGLLPTLLAADALLSAALAVALLVRSVQSDALLRLGRGLACGGAAVVLLVAIRPLLSDTGLAHLLLDPLAFLLGAVASLDLLLFLRHFPQPPPPHFFAEEARRVVPRSWHDWRSRWRRGPRRAEPGDPVVTSPLQERMANQSRRFHDWLGKERVHAGYLFLLTMLGACWSGLPGTGHALIEGVAACLLLLPLFGIGQLGVHYRHGSATDRLRIGWLWSLPLVGFVGFSAFYVCVLLAMVLMLPAGLDPRPGGVALPDWWLVAAYAGIPLLYLAVLLGLTMAVFYQGTLDPRLAIRRSTVVVLMGVVLTTLFVATEGAVAAQIVTRAGWPDQTGAVVAGTVVAVAFAPLRRLLDRQTQRLVNRLLPVRDLADSAVATVTVGFVDLGGYTALAARDEREALLVAGLLHKTAQAAATAHGGSVVKLIGDAVLLRLPDPVAGIAALRELRQRYQQGAAVLGVPLLPLHAGLHHGEVRVARDGDLLGAVVNLAARLQGAAGDDELLVSAAVLDGIEAAPEWRELRLKNIPEPVRAAAVHW